MTKLVETIAAGMASPPRLSFSDDVALGSHHQLRRVPSAVGDDDEYSSAEFDFGASIFEAASADELFSGGKILPSPAFPFKNTTNPALPQPAKQPIEKNNRAPEKKDDCKVSGSNVVVVDSGGNVAGAGRWAFWSRIRRSGSVNGDYAAGGDGAGRRYSTSTSLSASPSMRRSKSTGYYDAPPNQKQHFPATKPRHQIKNTTFESRKTYYYSGLECRSFSGYRNTGGAVRIVPVLNVRPVNLFGSWRSGGGGSSGRSTGGGGAMIDDGGGATTSSSSYCSFYESSSMFDYLLCKCSSKGSIKSMEVV